MDNYDLDNKMNEEEEENYNGENMAADDFDNGTIIIEELAQRLDAAEQKLEDHKKQEYNSWKESLKEDLDKQFTSQSKEFNDKIQIQEDKLNTLLERMDTMLQNSGSNQDLAMSL
eukprot:10425417-Ditylum_brightwellii.AAC.1